MIKMSTYREQKKQINSTFQQVQALAIQRERKDIAKSLDDSATQFNEGKLTVVVAGEFKQGKSCLINALINEKDLFPVDIDIATNLVSTITYGQEERISVVLEGQENSKKITRAEISEYVTEQKNKKNHKKAQLLEIESPNPQLKEGLVLFDTPGVGGLNIEHTAISYTIVTNADVVLFVSDILKPYQVRELEFIKKINRDCQTILFIITKKDLGNYQSIVTSNTEKLVKTLGWTEEQIKLIPVSSHAKLAYLETKDEEDLTESNFETLENYLWHILEQQRGSILSLRALTVMKQALTQIRSPVEAEWNALQQSPDELAKLEQELEETQQRLQDLTKNHSEWQNKLNDGLQDIKEHIINSYRQGVNQISEQVEIELDKPEVLANPESIVEETQEKIILLSIDLTNEISKLASNLQQEIRQDTQLDINVVVNTSIINSENETSSFNSDQIKKTTLWEKSLNVAQNTFFKKAVGTSLGATVGGVLGGILGSLFGGAGAVPGAVLGAKAAGFLGLLGGGAIGVKQGLSNEKEKTKRQVSVAIKKFISQTQKPYLDNLNLIIKQIQRDFRDEVRTQKQQEKETCDRTLRSLKESKKLTQEQTKRKITELKPLLQRINYLEQQITKFAEAALAQKEATPVTPTSKPFSKERKEAETLNTTADIEDNEDWADG